MNDRRTLWLIAIGLLWWSVSWVGCAWAHIHDRPDLDAWFQTLVNGWGNPCCEFNEAIDIADANWDTAVVDGKSHYRILLKSEWVVIDEESVVNQPNKAGTALAWVTYTNGKPWVKCFLPGAGG